MAESQTRLPQEQVSERTCPFKSGWAYYMRKKRIKKAAWTTTQLKTMCYDKVAYNTELEAKGESKNWPMKQLRPYSCKVCYCWHLTSKPSVSVGKSG